MTPTPLSAERLRLIPTTASTMMRSKPISHQRGDGLENNGVAHRAQANSIQASPTREKADSLGDGGGWGGLPTLVVTGL